MVALAEADDARLRPGARLGRRAGAHGGVRGREAGLGGGDLVHGHGARVPARRGVLVGGGGGLGLLSLLELLGVAVEEEVDHDVPGVGGGDGAAHLEHHAREEVVEAADGVLGLVVGGDGDVDELERGVGVAERDGGEVHVRGLGDGLVIGPGVGEHEHAGLALVPKRLQAAHAVAEIAADTAAARAAAARAGSPCPGPSRR